MTAVFEAAKAIHLNGSELATLLGTLKPSRFTLHAIGALVTVVGSGKTGKVGVITGFANMQTLARDPNVKQESVVVRSVAADAEASFAEADMGLVVHFGDANEIVKLASIQPSGGLAQAAHALFVQRCEKAASAAKLLADPEQLVEIQSRIAAATSGNSDLCSWRVLTHEEAAQLALQSSSSTSVASGGKRREREEGGLTAAAAAAATHGGGGAEDAAMMQRLVDARVQRLQEQVSQQLTQLSQSRGETRSLQNELSSLKTALQQQQSTASAQQQQQQQHQQQQPGGTTGDTTTTKLKDTVKMLTGKVKELNNEKDQFVTAAAMKLKVAPTLEAVLKALK